MAAIAVLTHRYDHFQAGFYLLSGLFGHWAEWGHRPRVFVGPPRKRWGDLAIMHVDCSVVPPEYLDLVGSYPIVVNGNQRDNRKRAVSRHLVRPGDGWQGPVVVKSDFNFGGIPEWRQNETAIRMCEPPPHRTARVTKNYRIYESAREVPDRVWRRSDLVVERFLAEADERGYWLRTWIFFGDRERCNRSLSPNPIVKGRDVVIREPVPVPEEMRAERERLGFDYGKFDFVMHEGRPILLDANRTPGTAANLAAEFARGAADLAHGIDFFLKRADAAAA